MNRDEDVMSNVFNFSSLLDFIGLLLLLLRLRLLELGSNFGHITLVSLSFFQFIGNLLQSSSAAFKPFETVGGGDVDLGLFRVVGLCQKTLSLAEKAFLRESFGV